MISRGKVQAFGPGESWQLSVLEMFESLESFFRGIRFLKNEGWHDGLEVANEFLRVGSQLVLPVVDGLVKFGILTRHYGRLFHSLEKYLYLRVDGSLFD